MIRAGSNLLRQALSQQSQVSSFSSAGYASNAFTATLFPGDGVGPDIANAVKSIFAAAGVPVTWDEQVVAKEVDPRTNSFVTRENLDSVLRHKVGLKGPMTTPIGKGFRSLNLTLRKELELFANVRPCLSLPGYKTRYDNVDLVTVRENTEGEYSGLEHEVVPGVVESLKVITRKASSRVAEFAFKYAKDNNRNKITAVHKANIMKKADGLFLECCREVREKYPEIQYEEVIVDNCCMQLVRDPGQFDVMVMPNLYGDIISDLSAGLIGGLGLTPSANIGENGLCLAEAVHGTAPDIAGKDLANPTALAMSGIMMLRHKGLSKEADNIQQAILKVIADGKYRTKDLGGEATTSDFTKAVIGSLQ
ncbi:isocitrate dehydrogenase, NAD-dependent [Dunaliella salina]|uniref:Isocitrate dehydrogenase, NAD-dependent n=1 Tax=Dunaliella salina TaxID=3046 RepID=A0ABQ7GFC6_DUNSA|nr:isocitrate dehydrogenase, NAD-dependent [Dunaliella salina]|eukprot:KAF5833312.1 isocitrate dehydrogenase, NAD-dependent [Dunaliella salina]